MIGKAYVSTFPFYNNRTHKMEYKNRPVLIIGKADNTDFVVLPISRVTNRINLDLDYDIEIDPVNVPLMNLKQVSYIRTHKQNIAHLGELTRVIVDFKTEYPAIFHEVILKVEQFQKKLIQDAK